MAGGTKWVTFSREKKLRKPFGMHCTRTTSRAMSPKRSVVNKNLHAMKRLASTTRIAILNDAWKSCPSALAKLVSDVTAPLLTWKILPEFDAHLYTFSLSLKDLTNVSVLSLNGLQRRMSFATISSALIRTVTRDLLVRNDCRRPTWKHRRSCISASSVGWKLTLSPSTFETENVEVRATDDDLIPAADVRTAIRCPARQ